MKAIILNDDMALHEDGFGNIKIFGYVEWDSGGVRQIEIQESVKLDEKAQLRLLGWLMDKFN